MSWQSETSSDEKVKIHYNTTLGEVKIEDLETGGETWTTPIDSSGAEEIESTIVPGFSNGKWMIKIGKLIKEALT